WTSDGSGPPPFPVAELETTIVPGPDAGCTLPPERHVPKPLTSSTGSPTPPKPPTAVQLETFVEPLAAAVPEPSLRIAPFFFIPFVSPPGFATSTWRMPPPTSTVPEGQLTVAFVDEPALEPIGTVATATETEYAAVSACVSGAASAAAVAATTIKTPRPFDTTSHSRTYCRAGALVVAGRSQS